MSKKLLKRGFTLIELLIVMAILGILAVVVIVAMNPAERQAQARDAGRVSAVAQLGRTLQAYYTSKAVYPNVANWADDLITTGNLSAFPSGLAYNYNLVTGCSTYAQPAVNPVYCYNEDQVNANGAIIFSKAESTSYRSKCTAPEEAFFVFSTEDSRGGVICSSIDPVPWVAGTKTYVP